MKYELHPLCTLFPRLSGTEFDALVDDIAANGLREPIVLHDGMIIDGGNRAAACYATGTPDSRISQLKTGCPFPIEVAATMLGGYEEERSLHKRFAAIRAHGEWFHAAPTLLEFIGSIGAEA